MTFPALVNRVAERFAHRIVLGSKDMVQTIGHVAAGTTSRTHAFVAGAQRSGTNMLMNALERSFDTVVYHETDPRAFDEYGMRDPHIVAELARRCRARLFVIKALCELDRLPQLMNRFAPARTVWIVRNYDDVVNSALVAFKSLPQSVARVVRERDASDWRARGMSDETHAILRRLHHDGINAASAVALFWYARNVLFFELGLDRDPRVMPVRYESVVAHPQRELSKVFDFLDVPFRPGVARGVFASSVRRQPTPPIDLAIRRLCDDLSERFVELAYAPRPALAAAG